ncbi:hypothetical protein BH24ACT13_BH24ACT13_07380 [soil metagenome]|jgi:hypothetical protein
MSPSILGLLIGSILALAGMLGGFDTFLVVLLLGAVGFVVGKAIEGDLDVKSMLGGSDRQRS